jgi:enterochelin esterase family protein
MGGGQSLRVLTACPEKFGYVVIWSAGLVRGNSAQWEQKNSEFLGKPEKVNASVKLLSISVADREFALPGTRALIEVFEKHGIKHEMHISGGGHTWINCRHYLN